jgi:porphobilinogen synthase
MNLTHRPRRNRKSAAIRLAIQEVQVRPEHLILPLFLLDGTAKKEVIPSMPGIFRLSLDAVLVLIEDSMKLGINMFDVFPAVDDSLKDSVASYSYASHNFYCKAIREIKSRFPEAVLTMTHFRFLLKWPWPRLRPVLIFSDHRI